MTYTARFYDNQELCKWIREFPAMPEASQLNEVMEDLSESGIHIKHIEIQIGSVA